MYSSVGSPGASRTTWASQIFSNSVRGGIGAHEVYNGPPYDEPPRGFASAWPWRPGLIVGRVPAERPADASAHPGAADAAADRRSDRGHGHHRDPPRDRPRS